jgi:hypothetical protein
VPDPDTKNPPESRSRTLKQVNPVLFFSTRSTSFEGLSVVT